MSVPATVELPGGAYTAERAPSGKWTVHDVPIFAEHVREDFCGDPLIIGADWLRAALAMATIRRNRDGYLAPLHIRHHDLGFGGATSPVESAGFILPTRVGTMAVEGRDRAVLFADLLNVPDAIYQRIRAGELPYRSVEILNTAEPPEISSLALMDHDVPYFRLPLLTIGDETQALAACRIALPRKQKPIGRNGAWSICAAAARGQAKSILYRQQETRTMADTVIAAAPPATIASPNQSDPAAPPIAAVTAAEPAPADDMTATIAAAVTAAMAPMLAAIAEIKTLCEAMMSKEPEDQETEEPAAEEPAAVEPAAAPGGTPAEATKAQAPASDPMQAARCSALESVQAATAKTLAAVTMARAGLHSLAGYAITADTEDRLRAIADNGGQPAVDEFVKTVQAYGSKEPPRARKGSAPTADAGIPAEVMHYQAISPAAFDRAKAAAVQYADLNGRTGMTLAAFISAQMYDFAAGRK
jgi:hypothetical protein